MKSSLDDLDKAIIEKLAVNAQTPYAHIAKELIVSPATVHSRVKKMSDLGLIHGSTLNINYKVIGWDLSIFLGIVLKKSASYRSVVKDLEAITAVVQVYLVSGRYDVFVKMHAKNTAEFKTIYHDTILEIKGIKNIDISVLLDQKVNRHIKF